MPDARERGPRRVGCVCPERTRASGLPPEGTAAGSTSRHLRAGEEASWPETRKIEDVRRRGEQRLPLCVFPVGEHDLHQALSDRQPHGRHTKSPPRSLSSRGRRGRSRPFGRQAFPAVCFKGYLRFAWSRVPLRTQTRRGLSPRRAAPPGGVLRVRWIQTSFPSCLAAWSRHRTPQLRSRSPGQRVALEGRGQGLFLGPLPGDGSVASGYVILGSGGGGKRSPPEVAANRHSLFIFCCQPTTQSL